MDESKNKAGINIDIKEIENVNRKLLEKAAIFEKSLTPIIKSVANEQNAEIRGLEFCLKTENSSFEKIYKELKETNKTLQCVSDTIYDLNRYTMILNENEFGFQFTEIVSALNDIGYELKRVKNSFNAENTTYKGVNCVFESKNGQFFELQFHTEESIDIKENISHHIYEKMRKLDNKDPKYKEYRNYLIDVNSQIKTPKLIELIRNFDELKYSFDKKSLLNKYVELKIIDKEDIIKNSFEQNVKNVDDILLKALEDKQFQTQEYMNILENALGKELASVHNSVFLKD